MDVSDRCITHYTHFPSWLRLRVLVCHSGGHNTDGTFLDFNGCFPFSTADFGASSLLPIESICSALHCTNCGHVSMQADLLTHSHQHIPRHAPLQFLDLLSKTLLLAAQKAYLVLQLLHDLRLLLSSEERSHTYASGTLYYLTSRANATLRSNQTLIKEATFIHLNGNFLLSPAVSQNIPTVLV